MRRKRCAAVLVLLGLLLALPMSAGAGHEPFAVFEDWSSATLRSDRWIGTADPGQELVREVGAGALTMRYRREHLSDVNQGAPFFSSRISAVNPFAIDQFQVTARVRHVEVKGCDANPTPSTVRALAVDFAKFNDLPGGSTPGNATGDYNARIEVLRRSDSLDPPKVLTVRGIVFRCNVPGCGQVSVIGLVELGQVRVNEKFRLRLIWDEAGGRFLVGLDDGPNVPLPYVVTTLQPPGNPFATIRIQHLPANCTDAAGGPTVGDATVQVLEVLTNSSAVVE